MNNFDESPLVITEWLVPHLVDPRIRIVDVRWKSRFENGRGIGFDDFEEFMNGQIPGAVFARIAEDLSNPHVPFSDAFIDAEQFSKVMSQIRIDNKTHVIAYDDTGIPFGHLGYGGH